MANKYISAHMQLIWAVKFRQGIITEQMRESVEKIICWWFAKHGHTVVAIYCMPDHIHVLFQYHPAQSVSELVQIVKTEATKFIKRTYDCPAMKWQGGYALFTYGKEAVRNVKRYILNQAEHHGASGPSFLKEIAGALIEADIDYDDRFFFEELKDWPDAR